MRARLLVVLLVTGCDALFRLEHVERVDAAPDGPLGPWQAPMQIVEVSSTGDEADASLSGDKLLMMFSSNRTGGRGDFDLYIAHRESESDPFGTPVLVSELSTTGADHGFLSDDGLMAYMNRTGDIWRASRPDRMSAFDTPVLDAGLSTTAADYNPAVAPNGLAAVIDHDAELFLFARESLFNTWGVPDHLSELTSAAVDGAGTLDADGLTIVFHSERVATEGRNIYISERSSVAERFTVAAPISILNSPLDDSDPHITGDGRTLVFNRDGKIYISTR